jgi:hypothetical protein
MYALETRAPAEVFVPRLAHSDLKERKLLEFRPELRGPVKALARRHRNLADLALSFPALLFALAHPRKGFDPEPAIRAVVAGETLGFVSALAGVPRWLRHVEPRVLTAGLPSLPDSAFLRRTIVNHLPRKAKYAATWFATVSAAARDGTEEFALWCARHLAHGPDKDIAARLRLLALWAFYCEQNGTQGHALIEHAFHQSLTVRGALAYAKAWQIELELHLEVAQAQMDEMWFESAIVDGYEFVPLRTDTAIREEAQAMHNCLRTYGYSVASGAAQLWSIRKDGERVATLSAKRTHLKFVGISELKAARNTPVSREVLLAARHWSIVHARWDVPQPTANPPDVRLLSRAAWISLWRPYWLAKQRIPRWLGLAPSRGTIRRL